MYLAPLNLDLFFKKVFSNKRIAKSFLEDLLKIKITEITFLATEHKLSDDSVIVKFDFRCKIRGKYVIIEMQQRYKLDVNKRFYLYHCISTALQLETLRSVVITKPNGETYSEKNYSGLEPVITLIWMVDDTLNFKEDMIVFSTLPEGIKAFVMDDSLWTKPVNTILEERKKVLKILNNTTKSLDFFQQNRLIYIFQGNIVKNNNNEPYFKWLDFAQKSRNPKNIEQDFEQYKNDKIMAEVIRRLEKNKLGPKEFEYVSDLHMYEGLLATQEIKYQKQEVKFKKKLEKWEARVEQSEARATEAAKREAQEAARAEKAEKTEKERLLKAIKGFLLLGKDIPYISEILDISIEETSALAMKIQDK